MHKKKRDLDPGSQSMWIHPDFAATKSLLLHENILYVVIGHNVGKKNFLKGGWNSSLFVNFGPNQCGSMPDPQHWVKQYIFFFGGGDISRVKIIL